MVGVAWSREEVNGLIEIYPFHSALEIAQKLGRSVTSIENKAKRLGLKKNGEYIAQKAKESGKRSSLLRGDKVWTEEDIRKFVQLYPTTPNEELARMFGCSEKAIRGQAWLLHLRKDKAALSRMRSEIMKNKRHDLWIWSNEEVETLKTMYSRGDSLVEIAEALVRTLPAVQFRVHKLKLKRNRPYLSLQLGKEGEKIAEKFFRKHGWKIIDKGVNSGGRHGPTAFDFIVESDKMEKYAINVKYGKGMLVSSRNLKNMMNLPYSCAFLFITMDKTFFFMPVIPLNTP